MFARALFALFPLHKSPTTPRHSAISNRWCLRYFCARTAPSISNRYTLPIKIRPNPLTTNEKTFSNRYDSFQIHIRAAPHPLLVTDHSSLPHLISIRYKSTSQNHHSRERSSENKGETAFYSIQICPSCRRRCKLPITNHYSPVTNPPHKSRVTNHDSRYNCASKCAAGQSNTQPLAQPATGNRRGTKPASACGHLILRH